MKVDFYADYIFQNGKIITVNNNDDICEALAVKDNKIIYVGDKNNVNDYIGDNTKIIDLAGRAVTPGFIDGHIHFSVFALQVSGAIKDIAFNQAPSIEAIKEILAKEVKEKKPGQWIYLMGYDQNKLKEGRHPNRDDFDDVAPDNPVRCIRACGHMSVFNSKALELAKVDENTEFDNKDEIEFDENGRLTGLLKEASASRVSGAFELTREETLRGFVEATNILLKYGVTGIHEAWGYNSHINILQDGILSGDIKMRAYIMYCNLDSREAAAKAIRELVSIGPHTGIGNEWFKMGPAKILLDGSTSGPSCFTREPYSHDPNLKGIINWPDQDEINDILLSAHKEGFKLTAHAVGDGAVNQILTAYESIMATDPRENARFRIEHCGLTDSELINRIKKLNAVVISNPVFITINGNDYNKYYGKRTEMFFAHRSYKENGIIEGFGSDYPVAMPNPLHTIYGAVTRKDIKNNVECGASQKLNVLEAIRSHTYNNAFASCEEEMKGSLEVGKLADITVLSEDILSCDPEHIKDITVDITMLDGNIEYQKEGRGKC